MGVIKTRFFWAFIGLRDYGFRRGRAFGFVFLPRPDKASDGCLIPGLVRMDGWIDWLTFDTRWSFSK